MDLQACADPKTQINAIKTGLHLVALIKTANRNEHSSVFYYIYFFHLYSIASDSSDVSSRNFHKSVSRKKKPILINIDCYDILTSAVTKIFCKTFVRASKMRYSSFLQTLSLKVQNDFKCVSISSLVNTPKNPTCLKIPPGYRSVIIIPNFQNHIFHMHGRFPTQKIMINIRA